MFYHITKKINLDSIREKGLVPQIGKNCQDLGEIEPAIYLFPDKLTAFDAISNWFGECFEEDEEIVLLEIDSYNIMNIKKINYEILVYEKIPYEKIISIKNANNELSYMTKKLKI